MLTSRPSKTVSLEADMQTGKKENYPLAPEIILELSEQIASRNFSRYLTFESASGERKRLKVRFRHKEDLIWEATDFPNGLAALHSLVDPGNRELWDHIYLENRGGRMSLPIRHLKLVMVYDNPPGTNPKVSDHLIDGMDLAEINHKRIPLVDWEINMELLTGFDRISLDEFRIRTLYKWAHISEADPEFVRAAVRDFGKSGSDGFDKHGKNPKYGGQIRLLCSEFVSWYYYQYGIQVHGKSLRDIEGTQQLHDLFEAEEELYAYKDEGETGGFFNTKTGERYLPQPGDYLERRGPNGAEHSMMIYRWLPKDPTSWNDSDREDMALVINGPWPVTLRLVRIERDEANESGDNYPKQYFVGKVDG